MRLDDFNVSSIKTAYVLRFEFCNLRADLFHLEFYTAKPTLVYQWGPWRDKNHQTAKKTKTPPHLFLKKQSKLCYQCMLLVPAGISYM